MAEIERVLPISYGWITRLAIEVGKSDWKFKLLRKIILTEAANLRSLVAEDFDNERQANP
jgi:predicted rRNA methylase YqxC with S4 and FtsJ domains